MLSINLVVLGMRTYESDIDNPVSIVDPDDQPVFVTGKY